MVKSCVPVAICLAADNPSLRGRIAQALFEHDDLLLVDPGFLGGWRTPSEQMGQVGINATDADDNVPLPLVGSQTYGSAKLRPLLIARRANDAIAELALRAGYFGMITFDEIANRLPTAIRAIALGGVAFPAGITDRIIVEKHGLRLRPRAS